MRIKKQYYIGDEEKSLCLVRWPLIYFKRLLSLRLTLKIQITLPFAGTGGQNDSRHISATGITDDKQMRSLLLFCTGDTVHEIFDNLPGAQEAEDYKATLKLLTDHFSQKKE